jgi:hypothetical protein
LAEFTPLGATAGWLKLATQVIGASSSRHRHDDPHHQPVIDMMILGLMMRLIDMLMMRLIPSST